MLEEPETAGCEERLPACSQAAGAKALRVRLELALFPSSVCFPSPRPATSPPKDRSAEVSRVGVLIVSGCVCKHPQFCSKPDQRCLYPGRGLGSSARLWHGVGGAGLAVMVVGCNATRSLRCFTVLFEYVPTVARSPGHLCVPPSNLFPGSGSPRFSARLRCGVSGARCSLSSSGAVARWQLLGQTSFCPVWW